MTPRMLLFPARSDRSALRTRIALSLALGAPLCVVAATAAQSEVIGIRAASVARPPKNLVADAIEEASRRFHVPASWLRAVMRAESAGDANSVSEKGAIGLMQVMPETYAELRAKHGFGPDPFEPSDNILAGAAYLAEMFARYGASGFLAAYNAGPGRYEEHVFRSRPLPDETTDYVARLAPELGLGSVSTIQIHAPSDAPRAPIFVALSTPKATSDPTPDGARKVSRTIEKAIPHPLFPASSGDTIFAREAHSDVASKASSGAAAMRTNGLFIARTSQESAQ